MESSKESVFLGPGASWTLAFSCRNLGKKILPGKKTESTVGFSSLEDTSQMNCLSVPLFL